MSFRFFYSIPLYAFYFLPLNCFQKTVKSKHEIRNIHLNFCTVSFLILTPVHYEPAAHFYFDKLVKRYSSKIFNLHTSLCCCCARFSWSIYRRVYWSCAQVSPISKDGCTKLKSFLVSFFFIKRELSICYIRITANILLVWRISSLVELLGQSLEWSKLLCICPRTWAGFWRQILRLIIGRGLVEVISLPRAFGSTTQWTAFNRCPQRWF